MTPKMPTLGEAGTTLWLDVLAENELRPDELRILADACRTADMIVLMEGELARPGFALRVKGSMGQEVINPIVSELRQHRMSLSALLKQLRLADADSPQARSASARAAANARWHPRGA